jgi:hypothetical protein
MSRNVYEVNEYDLSVSGVTLKVPLNRRGPISIQPVLVALTGTPTYTVEVSNDGTDYVEYHPTATNIDIDCSIWIAYDIIPWAFLRFVITSGGATGTVRFKLSLADG